MNTLANDRIVSPTTPHGAPEVWVIHGILGSRRNWHSFVRRLAALRPDLAFRTIDLRHHGDSHGFPPPDTLDACADDLAALAVSTGCSPAAVIGHSFGGKVVMVYSSRAPQDLRQAWVLDASPAIADRLGDDSDIARILEIVGDISLPIEGYEALQNLLLAKGLSEGLSQWMTTNLRRDPAGGFAWRFDPAGVERMMTSYLQTDTWAALEHPAIADMHLIRAGRGDRWSASDKARIAAAPIVDVVMERAGHWLHADDPATLMALLRDGLLDTP